MKIQINIEKKHFFILLGVIVLLAGSIFVYAQTYNPPTTVQNPGHTISSVYGAAPNCLAVPSPTCTAMTFAQQKDAAFAAAAAWDSVNLGGVSSSGYCRSDGTNCLNRWTPISVPSQARPLCLVNAAGVCNTGVTGTRIPSSYIPSTAKEVLIHAWFQSGQSGVVITQIVTPKYFDIYTQEGTTKYSHRLFASYGNSEDFWLPITSDGWIYTELIGGSISGNPRSNIEFIGYR